MERFCRLVLTGLCAAVGLALLPAVASADLTLKVPPLVGKAKVGTRSFQITDNSRPAGFDQPGKRRLMVQVTYPRKKRGAGPCRTTRYLPELAQARLMGIFALQDEVKAVTRSCAGGPVMKRRSPMLVFSHAYTANRAVYTALINDLASRGFIVASLDHTYDAFTVEFPGGDLVNGLFGTPIASTPVTEETLISLLETRTADVRFLTDRLMRLNRKKGSWLYRRIDGKRMGAFGHSLGGATAVRAASLDRRFRAAADIDGSLYGDWSLTESTDRPLLMFVAEDGLGSVFGLDRSCRWYGAATGPKFAWQLNGAKHLTFSDLQILAPQIAEQKPDWAFAPLYPLITGSLDPATSVRLQRRVVARFFKASLPRPGVRYPKLVPPAGVEALAGDALTCAAEPG